MKNTPKNIHKWWSMQEQLDQADKEAEEAEQKKLDQQRMEAEKIYWEEKKKKEEQAAAQNAAAAESQETVETPETPETPETAETPSTRRKNCKLTNAGFVASTQSHIPFPSVPPFEPIKESDSRNVPKSIRLWKQQQ